MQSIQKSQELTLLTVIGNKSHFLLILSMKLFVFSEKYR